MSDTTHTYHYYARLTPGDEKPSVWCGDIDGPNVHKLREHRFMLLARLHAAWRNWRRPEPCPLTVRDVIGEDAEPGGGAAA